MSERDGMIVKGYGSNSNRTSDSNSIECLKRWLEIISQSKYPVPDFLR